MSKNSSQAAGDAPVAAELPALFAWPAVAASGGAAAVLQPWGGEYMTDAVQRTILFWDVMRQRSDQYYAQKAQAVPHVLSFDAELVLDARSFDKPVNYLLVRIKPPPGVAVDPRSGPSSSSTRAPATGRASAASRPTARSASPCVPATPATSSASARADAGPDHRGHPPRRGVAFLEEVIALHPEAEGKPCVIGNCQAGWAVMMVAAIRPELFGPIIIPARRCPTGPAWRARTRCATPAACSAAAG
jgi:hypothetical protein